jgi:hypothetical protein
MLEPKLFKDPNYKILFSYVSITVYGTFDNLSTLMHNLYANIQLEW